MRPVNILDENRNNEMVIGLLNLLDFVLKEKKPAHFHFQNVAAANNELKTSPIDGWYDHES